MDPLRLFVPLAKADASQRLVYGYFDETPDRAGEVFDYATSKPNFEAWSAEMAKASDGKSLGNIRGQHSNIAAGKLVDITYDDDLKKVGFVAKIVDDGEWKKVEEGVYTGFSPGGRYAKRWQDGSHRRYTALVKELSIVDVPCNPSATFTMVKTDGAEEEREFVLAKAYEPGNEATRARADDLAKAAGKEGRGRDYVVQARAELIAENAADALAKMDQADDGNAGTDADDPATKMRAALSKADALLRDGDAAPKIGLPEQYRDFAKSAAALNAIAAAVAGQPILAKGMYTVQRTACLLETVANIASSVAWEEKDENDTGSTLPAMAIGLVNQVKAFLVEMANEEVAELLAQVTTQLPDFTLSMIPPEAGETVAVMELANQIVDLVKADTALMEKAGARNSKSDAAMIQSMHDNAVSLGATCDAGADKDALSAVEADRDRLAKAFNDAVPKVEKLTELVETLRADRDADRDALAKAQAEIDMLKAQPMPPKGSIRAIDKENDGATANGGTPPLNKADAIRAMPNGPAKARAILELAGVPGQH